MFLSWIRVECVGEEFTLFCFVHRNKLFLVAYVHAFVEGHAKPMSLRIKRLFWLSLPATLGDCFTKHFKRKAVLNKKNNLSKKMEAVFHLSSAPCVAGNDFWPFPVTAISNQSLIFVTRKLLF